MTSPARRTFRSCWCLRQGQRKVSSTPDGLVPTQLQPHPQHGFPGSTREARGPEAKPRPVCPAAGTCQGGTSTSRGRAGLLLVAHSLLESAGDNILQGTSTRRLSASGEDQGRCMGRNRSGQEMEFPTLLIPLVHHGRFQLPLDDSQTSARPSEEMPPPEICTRKPLPQGPFQTCHRSQCSCCPRGPF